ncbi:hypothetical protein E6C60_0566 [Paenibacillus algicola]|uniref:Glycosyl transferase family 1 domain-containing protein n=1 Tax=Paenibacillus algicola TaxID=2565926 RepID=A0A4P8XM42_9BACL|nr:glycosyltransferase family 4 protein [Paenibacillus algicola]QCT01289.1 hypothetical protein E6C60_0566 [Paenibacillus algicola]
MKVLFTFFNPSGGMETLNRVRCKALMQHGIECHLLYTHDGEGRKNIKGIKTFILSNPEQIQALIRREHYDTIVICSDIQLMEWMHQWGYTGHLIYEIQGLGTVETAREILVDYQARIEAYATALLYPRTSHIQNMMKELFPGKLHFCFDNPLDTERFHYIPYPPKPFPILGWIGRIEKNKNWRDFLKLGAALKQRYPDMYLWMFGDDTLFHPQEQAAFQQMVAELQLSEALIQYSNVPHEIMADYLSIIGDSGGLLCSTSITEGFGYAVAEAMLCRCPVLATDSDGIRAFLYPGKTGLFYEMGNIEQALRSALLMMENAVLRSLIVDSAEALMHQRFSAAHYVRHFNSMHKVLSRKRRGEKDHPNRKVLDP